MVNRQDCIYEILFILQRVNVIIVFMWISAHIGIKGNEAADVLTKVACKLDEIMKIIYSKSKEWQYNWDREVTGRHY